MNKDDKINMIVLWKKPDNTKAILWTVRDKWYCWLELSTHLKKISGKIYIYNHYRYRYVFLFVYVTDKDEYLDIGVIDTMILKDSRFSPDKYWLFGLSVNNSSKSTISSKLTISDSCEKMKLRDLTHRTCSKLSWFPTIKIPIFTRISFRQDWAR
jgi:hypothetical protein